MTDLPESHTRRTGQSDLQTNLEARNILAVGVASRDSHGRRILFKYELEFYIKYYSAAAVSVFWFFLFTRSGFSSVIDLTSYTDYAIVTIVSVVGILILVAPLIPGIGEWIRRASAVRRTGLVIFVIMPSVFVVCVSVVWLLGSQWILLSIRLVFLVFVTLFPAVLYYLFIATRRESLLNAYLANLDRLGLLGRRRLQSPGKSAREVSEQQSLDYESEASRRRRVTSYLERFEANYGRLPPNYVNEFLDATDPGADRSQRQRLPSLQGWTTPLAVHTTWPVVAAMILIGLGWIVVLPMNSSAILLTQLTGFENVRWASALSPDLSALNFAFLGAYFFSLQMIFRRFVRRDLGPNAYIAVVLRIILAMIGAWIALAALRYLQPDLSRDAILVIAFAIGAFPLIIWQLIVGVTKKIPLVTFALPSLKTDLPLSDLDGLSVWHEARLEEEDIENIPNMAVADIVDLILNTKFPPNRIIDWVDQAILYTNIGAVADPNRKIFRDLLRGYGIRTASALVDLSAGTPKPAGSTETVFPQAEEPKIITLAAAITTNPNLGLVQTWRGLPVVR